jgi:hypothetical protein
MTGLDFFKMRILIMDHYAFVVIYNLLAASNEPLAFFNAEISGT